MPALPTTIIAGQAGHVSDSNLAFTQINDMYSDSHAANLVWASPSAAPGAAVFRLLTSADIPSLSAYYQPLSASILTATAAATALAIMQRDANANVFADHFNTGVLNITGVNPTTVLTVDSPETIVFTGTGGCTIDLPDTTAGSTPIGLAFNIYHAGTGTMTITSGGFTVVTTSNGYFNRFTCYANTLLAYISLSQSGTGGGFAMRIAPTFTGLTLANSSNITFNTGTGSKIGTAVTEKLAFWNAAPIVQPSGATQAAVAATGSTQVTPFGFTTAAQADGIVTLLNVIRAVLVSEGLMKGSA